MPQAKLHDGSTIEIEVHGIGPTLLLPVNPQPVTGPQAEQMRKSGTDPALGQSLIKGLSDAFRVVAFDYEGQCLRRPKPDTLTPANTANDLLVPGLSLRSAGRSQRQLQSAPCFLSRVSLAAAGETQWLTRSTPCVARGDVGEACWRDTPMMASQARGQRSPHARWWGYSWSWGDDVSACLVSRT
ncbi:MAG: hypothetical protein ACJ8CB_19360 [Ktedonobacteraceae bacterium]